MMPHPGHPLDHGGDAVKGPQLPDKPLAASTPQQGLFDPAELDVGQPGCWSGRASAAQAVGTGGLPTLMPQVHALAGNAEPAGDLGLADADGNSSGAMGRRAWSLSRSCCAAGRRAMVGMTRS
jgi:hypothetical protein